MNIVKELRKKSGMQQKELAAYVGVSIPTVSEWEHNKKDPSGSRLKKLAECFQVDELVILGKGVIDLDQPQNAPPVTKEARIISHGIDGMPPEERERAVEMFRLMFSKYADIFIERNDDDEGRH